MNEATKKAEQIEREAKAAELSDKDLDNVAGGGKEDIGGIDIVVKKKPTQ